MIVSKFKIKIDYLNPTNELDIINQLCVIFKPLETKGLVELVVYPHEMFEFDLWIRLLDPILLETPEYKAALELIKSISEELK